GLAALDCRTFSLHDALPIFALRDASAATLEAARHQAREAGVPMKVLQAEEAGLADLYPHRYTLIRPDQHVAWRGDVWPDVAIKLLEHITGRGGVPAMKTQAA